MRSRNPTSPSIVGALPTLATAAAVSGTRLYVLDGSQFKIIDVTNPADGTRYEIRPHRLTLLMTDGHVAAQETMVAYWSIPTS